MRIALRPSGGRGDYELAGSFNTISASDLLEKEFYYQITPDLIISGKAQTHRLSGKPRIRPERGGEHPYVVISSLLLLPPPRRELIKTGDQELLELQRQNYTLAGIDVEIVNTDSKSVTFAPQTIWARNQASYLKLDYDERISIISTIWEAAGIVKDELSILLLAHKQATISSNHGVLKQLAKEILRFFSTDSDILPLLLMHYKLPSAAGFSYSGVKGESSDFADEDDSTSRTELHRERVRKWRLQSDRGPGAREFSSKVKNSYNYRCLFSGERFPKLDPLNSPGVDSAHILPWASHQLNIVENGICLCKQCHWAFDNGLLKLDFDTQTNDYILSIPEDVKNAAINNNFDLHTFNKNLGVLDKSRLPINHKLWPSPKNINELNSKLII